MRRAELFEIHDHSRFPTFLLDLVTDALQALWNFSNSYKPILPLLRNALDVVGTREILDLCSGGGGVARQNIDLPSSQADDSRRAKILQEEITGCRRYLGNKISMQIWMPTSWWPRSSVSFSTPDHHVVRVLRASCRANPT